MSTGHNGNTQNQGKNSSTGGNLKLGNPRYLFEKLK
jgi:hypothetical protein